MFLQQREPLRWLPTIDWTLDRLEQHANIACGRSGIEVICRDRAKRCETSQWMPMPSASIPAG